jgi:acyl-coenzyme A synthetase/AMP-(fatty) acid ligase
MRIEEILRLSAEKWPNRVALIDHYGSVTYGQLAKGAELLGQNLIRHGVGRGHGLGVRTRNGRDFVYALFGALQAGAAVLPIYNALPEKELADLLHIAKLHAILDDGSAPAFSAEDRKTLPAGAGRELLFYRTKRAFSEPLVEWLPDAALLRFTSGTTGASKGVVISHQAAADRIGAAQNAFQFTPQDVVLSVLPMAFHFIVSVLAYLHAGATIIVHEGYLPDVLLQTANRLRATFLYATPMHYRLLSGATSPLRFETLQRAISTSSFLPSETAHAFYARYGIPVIQAYGLIELGIPLMNVRHALDHPEAAGEPMPGYRYRLISEDGSPVEPGNVGRLQVTGPGMFQGYLNPEKRAADVLQDGIWFSTGDYATAEDNLVTIHGRSGSVIHVAGQKVFPEEIEAVLNRHPKVANSRVAGKTHRLFGEIVHADVVLRDKSAAVDMEELIRFCRRDLASYKTPQSIAYVDELPITASGKTRRPD